MHSGDESAPIRWTEAIRPWVGRCRSSCLRSSFHCDACRTIDHL